VKEQEIKCPFCIVEFHDNREVQFLKGDVEGYWFATKRTCPSCRRLIVELEVFEQAIESGDPSKAKQSILARPKTSSRPPAPPEVPAKYAEDYKEACLVLADSPKASAALSRRCLQNLLRDEEGVKHRNLFNEIQEAVNNGKLPSHIEDQLDAVRAIGNLAAHPTKDQNTGAIVPVEPGEAEWNLDVLEALFDHYFVRPAIAQKRKAAINQKLQQAGKNPI
jgi:hypothetical protein